MLIHIAMLLGQILLLVLAIWEIEPRREKQHDLYYQIGEVGVFVIGFILSYVFYIKYARKGRRRRGIREKLIIYKRGLYAQWGILEIIALSATIAYLMTGERMYILANIFAMVVFLVNRPSIQRTIDDLDLDDNESRVLRTPDAAI